MTVGGGGGVMPRLPTVATILVDVGMTGTGRGGGEERGEELTGGTRP
jgi:hypothetical protein